MVPKIGGRRSDGPILRFHFCGENVGRSFVVGSHDPFLRIRFLVPKIGGRRSDGPILRFRFCGENVGRSFMVGSHDPFLRIRFLVPKIGGRRSDGPILRFHFCGENVGRSFVVGSHDPFSRTNEESSIWRQNDHAKFVGAFHLSRRVSDENRACSISVRFFSNYGSV